MGWKLHWCYSMVIRSLRLFPIKLRTSPLEIIYNPNNEFIQRFSQKPSNAISEKIFHPLLS